MSVELTIFKDKTSITSVTLGTGVKFKDNTMAHLFDGCKNLAAVDLTKISTTGITDMSYLFSNCRVLPSVDVTNFDTSLVTTFEFMFNYCQKLGEIIGYEDFNTSKVETMYKTFNFLNLIGDT